MMQPFPLQHHLRQSFGALELLPTLDPYYWDTPQRSDNEFLHHPSRTTPFSIALAVQKSLRTLYDDIQVNFRPNWFIKNARRHLLW